MNKHNLMTILLAALVIMLFSYFLKGSIKPNILKTSPTPQANYENWNEIKNDRFNISLKYPRDWKIVEGDIINDSVRLFIKSPRNLIIDLLIGTDGVGGRCDIDPDKDLGVQQINIYKHQMYVHYYGDNQNNTISYAYLTRSESPCPNIPFFEIPNEELTKRNYTGKATSSIKIYYEGETITSVDKFKSADLVTAFLILSSVKPIKE